MIRLFSLCAFLLTVLFALTTAPVLWAEPLQEGLDAFKAGDYATSLNLLHPLAEKGEPKAQFAVGLMFMKGHGVTPSVASCAHWFEKAALQGHAKAQFNLAVLHDRGVINQTPNASEAHRWYTMAADQNFADALINLSNMYSEGRGVEKNASQAFLLISKAAEASHPFAQYNLGCMYERGGGVAADPKAALTWYQKSAEASFAPAYVAIGRLYQNGIGVEKNPATALMWFGIAQDLGLPEGAQLFKELASGTPSEILQQAASAAAEFRQKQEAPKK